MAKTVLIVEDERAIVEILKFNLKREGYETLEALDGETGLLLAQTKDPDLILLDVMLPKMNGFDICKTLRAENRTTPIIMLTAREEEMDKVFGLETGADDYMTKPFAIEELLARIRVGLKKRRVSSAEPASAALVAGPLRLDPASYAVSWNGTSISLTKKEFDLLRYLMAHKGQVVTRDTLLSDVWGYDYAGDTNVVDVYVRYLRHKIDEPFQVKTIHTIRAVGYMFSYE